MKDRMIAGPAWSAAATPVMTKMPPPMTAPIPSAVSPQGPRVRRRAGPWASSCSAWGAFLASNCLSMDGPGRSVRERIVAKGKAGGRPPAFPGSFLSAERLAQLAVPVAVQEVDQLADDDPAEHQAPVLFKGLPEQVDAGDRADDGDRPHERDTEAALQIRTGVAQDQHAEANGGEREQGAHR